MRGSHTGKIKQERQVSEVYNARNKLEGVLQTLMIKTEESSDSSSDESITSPESPPKETQLPIPSLSKRGSSHKIPRKRRRKDDSLSRDNAFGQQSYVMKLFDRSVNLAQFSEDSSLYPVVRAWMKNEPHVSCKSEPSSPEHHKDEFINVEDDEPIVNTIMPGPMPLPRDEEGYVSYPRIPSPLPQPDEVLDIHQDSSFAPSTDELLQNHMLRWKEVRQNWKDASMANEGRYKDSMSIIKSLFVR